MKPILLLAALLAAGFSQAQNVAFQSGSTGANGPFAPTSSTNIVLPPDGRLNFTWVSIPSSVTVTFTRNSNNTPVYFLAQQGITNHGTIRVNGESGTATRGGFGGPGGFSGGEPGIAGSAPGDGYGPGGGRGHTDVNQLGRGIYGALFPGNTALAGDGIVYGSQLLVPLVGGSGGGGAPNLGGAGGGGAILISSSTHITNSGSIMAEGGVSGSSIGSGGAIRMVAPKISGSGLIFARGGGSFNNHGRIRCDLIERQDFSPTFLPLAAVTADQAFMVTFPQNVPSLRLSRVAGQDVPLDAAAGYTVTLPFNAPVQQSITVEASGFGASVPVVIRLTPASGPATTLIRDSIPNHLADPATVTVTAAFPANIPVTVEAWTE